MRTLYLVLLNVIIFTIMLVPLCSPLPKPDDGDDTTAESADDTKKESSDKRKRKDQGCIEPGDFFDPINLYANDDFLEGRNSSEDNRDEGEWKKLRVNKYYGVLRDRFFVKNEDGLLTLQFRGSGDWEPTSGATIFGTEDDWKEEYILAKANIFFSTSKYHGSQHAIKGQTYALELQLVHYRKTIAKLADAAGEKNGILVLCILFESTGKANMYLDPVTSAAIAASFPSDKFQAAHGPLNIKALFPSDLSNLQYTGQYFAKPCAKQAKYVVFISPRTVSEKQLKKFREMKDHQGEPNPGIWGDYQGSPNEGVEVKVSKNVKLQVVKKVKISLAALPVPSSVVTSAIMTAQFFWFNLFRFICD